MSKAEKRLLDWVQQHLFVIFCVAITLCSMMIRFYFRYLKAGIILNLYCHGGKKSVKREEFLR